MNKGSVQVQIDKATAAANASRRRPTLAVAIQRLAAEDPAQARILLRYLNHARRTGRRGAVMRVLHAFGLLGGVVAEVAHPSPLTTRPARLADSWATVGRLIHGGMREFDKRHDPHVG